MPVAGVGLIREPSGPRPSLAERDVAWELIRMLGAGQSLLRPAKGARCAELLQDMLRLFLAGDDALHRKQIDGVLSLTADAVTRRLPDGVHILLGRGAAVTLTVDEAAFDGISPYLSVSCSNPCSPA